MLNVIAVAREQNCQKKLSVSIKTCKVTISKVIQSFLYEEISLIIKILKKIKTCNQSSCLKYFTLGTFKGLKQILTTSKKR